MPLLQENMAWQEEIIFEQAAYQLQLHNTEIFQPKCVCFLKPVFDNTSGPRILKRCVLKQFSIHSIHSNLGTHTHMHARACARTHTHLDIVSIPLRTFNLKSIVFFRLKEKIKTKELVRSNIVDEIFLK